MSKTFERVTPTDEQAEAIEAIRQGCEALEGLLLERPPSRLRSIALTELEGFSMWATKAIAHEPRPEE